MRPTIHLANAVRALGIAVAVFCVAGGDRPVRAQTTGASESRAPDAADGDLSAHLFQVEIALSEIRFDGEHVVDLEDGTPDASKWAEGPWSRTVAPLEPLVRRRLEAPEAENRVYPETLLLLPHPTARFDVLEGCAAAAHAAGLDRFQLGVEDPEHRDLLFVDIAPPSPDASRTPNVRLKITSRGFDLEVEGTDLPPRGDCPENGPTVCLSDRDVDVDGAVAEARSAYRDGDDKRGQERMATVFEAYDLEALQAALAELKEHRRKQTRYRLDAEPDIPAALVLATVLRARSTSVRERGLVGSTRDRRRLLTEPQFAR